MDKFSWPNYIIFDDSEDDINKARVFWNERRASLPDGGTITDFLEFMAAYSQGLESHRTQYLGVSARTA